MNIQAHYEKTNNAIMQSLNFQFKQRIRLSQLKYSQRIRSIHIAPYNSLVIVEYYNEGKILKILYEYENGSLIPFKIEEDFEYDQSKQCLFMKHTKELIILYENDVIVCYKIEQVLKWKIFQNIKVDRAFSIAQDEKEQTLCISNQHIQIYKRQTPNHFWVLYQYLLLEQFRGVTLDYGSNTITAQWRDIYILKCFQKIMRLQKFRTFFYTIITHIQDEFIITKRTIIQWNKQTRKLLRRYKPNIENKPIIFHSFDLQTQLFICSIQNQISICRFINGKFIVVQILPDEPYAIETKIGNNGQLLIQAQFDQLIIYEQKQ